VSLAEALDAMARRAPLPPRAVALTFDDGYADNLALAAPLLGDLGIPATFFLAPDFLTGATRPWWEQLAAALAATPARTVRVGTETFERTRPGADRAVARAVAGRLKGLDRAGREAFVASLLDDLDARDGRDEVLAELMLDWAGARRLAAAGHGIGSHSMGHAILANESPAAQLDDLARSRRLLSEALDVDVRLLAYPNGTARDYDATTVEAAASAGYDWALTLRPGFVRHSPPPLEVRRQVVRPERGVEGLARALAAALTPMRTERRHVAAAYN